MRPAFLVDLPTAQPRKGEARAGSRLLSPLVDDLPDVPPPPFVPPLRCDDDEEDDDEDDDVDEDQDDDEEDDDEEEEEETWQVRVAVLPALPGHGPRLDFSY